MNKKTKLRKALKDTLKEKWVSGKGVSRHAMKLQNGGYSPYIHSYNTYKTYAAQCDHFADWCYINDYRFLNNKIDNMVKRYIDTLKRSNKSAWSIQTALCAISKALDRPVKSWNIDLPQRKREDIKRSRLVSSGDSHINLANYTDLIMFCKCFGLRKQKELEVLQVKDIEIFENTNGKQMRVQVASGKGGKARTVPFCGSDAEKEKILSWLQDKDPESLAFPHIPGRLDVHSYRADYARRLYDSVKRPIEGLDWHECYICRKDKKGERYDRKALLEVSRALGHNREDVVVNHYMYKLSELD